MHPAGAQLCSLLRDDLCHVIGSLCFSKAAEHLADPPSHAQTKGYQPRPPWMTSWAPEAVAPLTAILLWTSSGLGQVPIMTEYHLAAGHFHPLNHSLTSSSESSDSIPGQKQSSALFTEAVS